MLGECDRASDCTAFVAFMLAAVREALAEGLNIQSDMSEEMSEEMSEKMSEETRFITEAERAVIALLVRQPELTAKVLASMLNVSARTVERHLKSLQQKGKLTRVGAKKGGFWRVQ